MKRSYSIVIAAVCLTLVVAKSAVAHTAPLHQHPTPLTSANPSDIPQVQQASIPEVPPEAPPEQHVSVNTETGPYLNLGIGLANFEEQQAANQYKHTTKFAYQVGYGHSHQLSNTPAPIFLGVEGNLSYYGKWRNEADNDSGSAYSIDALAIFGLQFNKFRTYLKGGPDYVIADHKGFHLKYGAGVSYPVLKTFRVMAEVTHTKGLNGITSFISGIQYYF